jgi:DNA repair exonuclease SbcCD ATPase subunit
LTEIGAGEIIYELRKKIQKITSDLNELEKESEEIPELIKSTNILRTNDHLVEVNNKKSELTFAYEQYSKELEQLLATVFDIQKDLKEILKTQSSLISEKSPKRTLKTRKNQLKK